MKILHIISQRPDSTGSGIYLQAMLANACRAGHENFLVAALQDGIKEELAGVTENNCNYVHFSSLSEKKSAIFGMSDVMPYPSRQFRNLHDQEIDNYLKKYQKSLVTMVKTCRPDIIHTHHLWLLTAFVRQLFPDIPIVTSCHGSELRQFEQCPHLRKRVTNGCRKIDTILALSNDQKKQIAGSYAIPEEKIIVTGAGYDETLFYHGKKRWTPNTILYAGKLSQAKGVPWLLEALAGLDDYPVHIHLAGGGTGDEYDACLEKAGHFGHTLTFHGSLSQQKLAELMRSCQIFVLPSLHEGLPLVVLEALASDCQVIATSLPGTREIAEKLPGSNITLIEKPIVTDTNATIIGNEQRFIHNLQNALKKTLASSSPPLAPADLSYFTWSEVFKRIETIWAATIRRVPCQRHHD